MNRGIAVAGNLILDRIKIIPKLPARHGLVPIRSLEDSVGGAVCNTGIDLAKMDPSLPVKAVGLVGEDAQGDEILRRMGEYPNLDLARIRREGRTAFTDVLTEEISRARTFLVYNESGDRFDLRHVDVATLDCDLFHIGYALLLKSLDAPDREYGTRMAHLLHDVQAAGILTSLDVVSEDGNRYREIVPPSLRYTDYFIVNEIEAGKTVNIPLRDDHGRLLKERIPEVLWALRAMGVRRWAVIHAPEGGFGLGERGECVECPSYALAEGYVKGTVGAGDAFCAGVLLAAYRGLPLTTALLYGNASAACSLRQPGATEGMTTMEEILRLTAHFAKNDL